MVRLIWIESVGYQFFQAGNPGVIVCFLLVICSLFDSLSVLRIFGRQAQERTVGFCVARECLGDFRFVGFVGLGCDS